MKIRKVLKISAWIVMLILIVMMVAAFFISRTTDIPKLYIQGKISDMQDKSDNRDVAFWYVDRKQEVTGFARMKLQGTSSLYYDKKNYNIKLYADDAHKDKLTLDLGWGGGNNKYCLKANWIDRTHARNLVTAKLVTQIQQKYGVLTRAPRNGAVDGFPVEVYSNGDFLGLYTINIPKGAWQFGMDEENPNHIVVCGENWEPAALFRGTSVWDSWALEVGEKSDETLGKLQRLFEFVISSSDEEFKSQFEEYIDLDAALNYYILANFAYMPDNLGKNMLLATYDGQKWYPSLYDLDTTWGTNENGRARLAYDNGPLDMSSNLLFERMERCFPQELAQRYFELRQDILTKDHIMAEFVDFQSQIPDLVFFKEGLRWGNGVIRQHSDLPGYDYGQIEEYLDTVMDGLDGKYQQLSQY